MESANPENEFGTMKQIAKIAPEREETEEGSSSDQPNEGSSSTENRPATEGTDDNAVGSTDGDQNETVEKNIQGEGQDQQNVDGAEDKERAAEEGQAANALTNNNSNHKHDDETKEASKASEKDAVISNNDSSQGETKEGAPEELQIAAEGAKPKETEREAKPAGSQSSKRKFDADADASKESDDTKSNAATKPSAILPKRPLKRARTAYFIFTDEKRPKVQADHPGEGVAAVAKALGQMWGNLTAEEKKTYQDRAAKERERISQELEAYKAAGGKDIDSPAGKGKDPLAMDLPVARIRKICKLDPEVRGLSKEGLLLVTKCTEMMLQKLGKETVKVAQLQNRRKLLPDDVAHVCGHREQFLFLKDDVKDLVRTLEVDATTKTAGGSKNKGDSAKQAAAAGTKKLTAFFSASK